MEFRKFCLNFERLIFVCAGEIIFDYLYVIKIFQFFLELSTILFLPVDRCMTNEPEENEGLILKHWDFTDISTNPWYVRDQNWEPELLRRHESFLSEIKTSFTSRDAFEDLEREKDIVPLKIWCQHCTKMFSITDFFSKCDQIRRKLRICGFGHIYWRIP